MHRDSCVAGFYGDGDNLPSSDLSTHLRSPDGK